YPDFELCQLADPNGVGEPCVRRSGNLLFNDHHCAPGLYCDGAVCALAGWVSEGETCSVDPECVSGTHCISERCTAGRGGLGEICMSHTHCAAVTLYCDDGFCAPVLDRFELCEESAACSQPFLCMDGLCD